MPEASREPLLGLTRDEGVVSRGVSALVSALFATAAFNIFYLRGSRDDAEASVREERAHAMEAETGREAVRVINNALRISNFEQAVELVAAAGSTPIPEVFQEMFDNIALPVGVDPAISIIPLPEASQEVVVGDEQMAEVEAETEALPVGVDPAISIIPLPEASQEVVVGDEQMAEVEAETEALLVLLTIDDNPDLPPTELEHPG